MSVLTTILLFAETGSHDGTWSRIYNDYLNIPGFESWKFLHHIVFMAIRFLLVRKPV
jgi:hypothetical protein